MFSRIATLLSFVRVTRNDAKANDVTVDIGGGENHTAEHFAPIGDDSFPLISDYVIVIDVPQRNSKAAIGYLDPKNIPKANEGDKRIYSRDSAADVIAEVWLKNDGTITITNQAGSFEMQPGGNVVINNDVTIEPNGNITCKEITCDKITTPSAVINGVEHATHIHAQPNDSNGDTEANTTGPVGP